MREKLICSILLLALLLLAGCNGESGKRNETSFNPSPLTGEETFVAESVPTSVETFLPPSMQTEEVLVTTVHSHAFSVISYRKPTCLQEGEEVRRCSCGLTENNVIPKTDHVPEEARCGESISCSVCKAVISQGISHEFQGNVCARCGEALTDPIYVLGKSLKFDEALSSVQEKLGVPSAVITEGDLVSLVYGEDLNSLTVIQTDSDGLWGVFTMDMEARMFLEGKTLSIASFAGQKDPDSEAYYQDLGSCRIFGFRDTLEGGDYYGLWMRYSECEYDYMSDPRLSESYGGQSMLSYYFVNALRARKGLLPLTWSEEAAAVAKEYSQTMIDMDFFGHDNSYAERLRQKGIFWTFAGENISQGYFNLFFVVDAYYNSKSHRENILSSEFTFVGMGYCLCPDPASVYGAQIFYTK